MYGNLEFYVSMWMKPPSIIAVANQAFTVRWAKNPLQESQQDQIMRLHFNIG